MRRTTGVVFNGMHFVFMWFSACSSSVVNFKFSLRWVYFSLCVVALPVQANWVFSPRVLLTEAYTDNRTLASEHQEESDFITQVAPGFVLASTNQNFLVNLDYQLESILYAESSDDSDVFHHLDLSVTKNIFDDWASFDVAAMHRQSIVDSRGAQSNGNLLLSANQTNTTTLSYGPVFRWRPYSYLLGEMSFQHGITRYEDVDDADSEQWRGRVLLDATRYPGKIGWAFQYNELRTENDVPSTATFRRASADIYFRVTARASLIAGAGWDDNRFQSAIDSEQKGGSWRVGLIWNPRQRTRIAAFYNDRYFGESAEVRIHNRTRYTTVDVDYREDFESADQGLVADLVERDQLPANLLGTISTEVVKLRRGGVRVTRRHSKTEISIAFNRSRQELQQSLVRENLDSLRVGWKWLVSDLATIDISGRKTRSFFSDIDRTDHGKTVRIEYSYLLGRHYSAMASLSRVSRLSTDDAVEYVSNMLACSLTAEF